MPRGVPSNREPDRVPLRIGSLSRAVLEALRRRMSKQWAVVAPVIDAASVPAEIPNRRSSERYRALERSTFCTAGDLVTGDF